ncbi:hypothetical protein QE152_g32637 [Popillia japonica]|uniref:Uncharacterized protein n=1 Tax=Popillia japonica TaxID=7064 RepID=A0AAW1IYL7_POPJA
MVYPFISETLQKPLNNVTRLHLGNCDRLLQGAGGNHSKLQTDNDDVSADTRMENLKIVRSFPRCTVEQIPPENLYSESGITRQQ